MGPSVDTQAAYSRPGAAQEDYRGLRLTTEPLHASTSIQDHRRRATTTFGGFDWTMLGTSGLWPL
jgi:hypothetical protein